MGPALFGLHANFNKCLCYMINIFDMGGGAADGLTSRHAEASSSKNNLATYSGNAKSIRAQALEIM